MNILCKYVGGSNLYRTNTPNSDIDMRGVFNNTDVSKILGLERFDNVVKNNTDEDVTLTEVRDFLRQVKKGGSQAVESLFIDKGEFLILKEDFAQIRAFKQHLIDPLAMLNSVKGMAVSSMKSAFKDESVEYGYNPKLATTSIRISCSFYYLFTEGNLIYNCDSIMRSSFDMGGGCLSDLLRSIKFHPGFHRPEEVMKYCEKAINKIDNIELSKSGVKNYSFDNRIATELLKNIYKRYII